MNNKNNIQPHFPGKSLKKVRVIALAIMVIIIVTWSMILNLGIINGGTSTIYVQLNDNTHEGMLIIEVGGKQMRAWSNLKIAVEPLPVGKNSTGILRGWATMHGTVYLLIHLFI